MKEPKLDKEDRHFSLAGGDIGVILVALVFFLGTLYLFIGPSPFAALFARHEPAQTGEVSVSLPPPSSQQP